MVQSSASRILVQVSDPEVSTAVADLLAPYRYEVHAAETTAAAALTARQHGPFDLALCLEDATAARHLEIRLKEVSPETPVLLLRSARPRPSPDESSRSGGLETSSLLLDPTELMHLIESAFSAKSRSPDVTVDSLRRALIETTLTFSLLLEQHQFLNGGNGRLVMDYSIRIAREMGLSPTYLDEIAFASILQDIGLAKLRASELGRELSDEDQRRRVREHPMQSANLVQQMKLPWRLRHIIVAHHEWYNGLGYPRALRGRAIPLGARILAVTNTFFSMISKRPNRAALTQKGAMEELRSLAGRQFDPEVVEVFLSLMRDKDYASHGSGRHVAVLTGDASFGMIVRRKLTENQHEVTLLAGGEGTVSRLSAAPPDAIILDTELGDMNGFQLLHWLKKDPQLARVPVLVVAAATDDNAQSYLAHDMGADDYLVRPISLPHLIRRVHAIIRRNDRLARAAMSQVHDGEGLRGTLDDLGVAGLVRMLRDGSKTATVKLIAEGAVGFMVFDGGAVVHARSAEATGEDAFKQLYLWRTGDFLVEHGAGTAERSIGRRMDLLVSDAEEERLEAAQVELEASSPAVPAVTVPAPRAEAEDDRLLDQALAPTGGYREPRSAPTAPTDADSGGTDPAEVSAETMVDLVLEEGTRAEAERNRHGSAAARRASRPRPTTGDDSDDTLVAERWREPALTGSGRP